MLYMSLVLFSAFFVLTTHTDLSADDSVVVHEKLKVGSFPTKIIPGKAFALSGLKLKKGTSTITGTVNFKNPENKKDFLLIVYLSAEKQLLFSYYTDKARQVFITPAGKSGDVALTAEGYKMSSKGNQGTFEFKMPYSVYGVYNIAKTKGQMFVFLLDGNNKKQIKEDAFLGISNVVKAAF